MSARTALRGPCALLLLTLGGCATGEIVDSDPAGVSPDGLDASALSDASSVDARLSTDSGTSLDALVDATTVGPDGSRTPDSPPDGAEADDATADGAPPTPDGGADATGTIGDTNLSSDAGPADAPADAGPPDSTQGDSGSTEDSGPDAAVGMDGSADASGDGSDGAADGAAIDAAPPIDASLPDTSASDGQTSPVALPVPGEIVISEVMFNPSDTGDTSSEWIELYNAASEPKLLSGLTLTDGDGRTDTLPDSPAVTIAARAYVLLVRDLAQATTDKIPASAIVYEYGSLLLANGTTGGVSISNGATMLASVPYGPWGMSVNGASIQSFALSVSADSTASNWCVSTSSWATGSDFGTPGAPGNCP